MLPLGTILLLYRPQKDCARGWGGVQFVGKSVPFIAQKRHTMWYRALFWGFVVVVWAKIIIFVDIGVWPNGETNKNK